MYYRLSSYRAENTLRLGFKNQSVNAVWGNKGVLFAGPYKTQSLIILQAQIVPRRKHSSLYLRLLTSSGGLCNSNVLIVFLPSVGRLWNSKRYIITHLTKLYIRRIIAYCVKNHNILQVTTLS
jgi:hypothetical protein